MEGGVSLKEKAVFGGLLVGGLYAFAVVLWFTVFQASWADAKKAYEKAGSDVAKELKLISEKSKWDRAYLDEVGKIREIEDDQSADAVWLDVVKGIAENNHVKLDSLRASRATVADEMMKITIDLKWVGALESLVKFLYELETTDAGSFDVQAVSFNQYGKRPGFLTGPMTLECIFRRKTN